MQWYLYYLPAKGFHSPQQQSQTYCYWYISCYTKTFSAHQNSNALSSFLQNCFFKVVDHSLQNCPTCGYDLLVNSNKGYQRISYCKKGYFIEFPIINQILSFFRHVSFYESLQYRFKQNKRSLENIKDIYDWLIYQKHF